MTTIKDILEFFEEFAPVDTAMNFDNCGLLIGSKNKPVNRVLVALDITNEVVDEADRLGAELIISHHPVIFNAIKRLDSSSVPYRLAEKNISAVCMHTNLDLSESFGVNLCLANAVGLKNTRLCKSGECLFMGELDTDIESFAKRTSPTVTGKMIYKLHAYSVFVVQWETMLKFYPKAVYWGGIY